MRHHRIFHRGALVATWLVWNPGQKTDDTRTMFCHGRNVSGYQISVWEYVWMANRPFSNTSAFKRIVLDMKTEEAIAYDEALAVEMQQRPGLTRSAHIRELIVSFTQAKKGSKRGKA